MLRVALFFLSCTLLAGCPSPSTTVTTKQPSGKELRVTDYFPLKVGDRRVYKVVLGKQQTKIEVVIQKRIGNKFIELERRLDGKGKAQTAPKEVYHYTEYGIRGRNRYLLKYPLQVGTKWLSVVNPTTIEKYRIMSVNSTVGVPAGEYKDCIFVRSQDRDATGVLENRMYFAPKVGLVKVATFRNANGRATLQWTVELVSFERGRGEAPKK